MKKICIVAGHSAGHILPCITLAQKECAQPSIITSNNPFDLKIIKNYDFISKIFILPINKLPKVYQLPFFIITLKFAFIKSLIFLSKEKPNKIITTGGLAAVPACLAAKILRISVEIYELNVEPGKTVIFLAKFFKKINICFEETKKYFKNNICEVVDYPVRFTAHGSIPDYVLAPKGLGGHSAASRSVKTMQDKSPGKHSENLALPFDFAQDNLRLSDRWVNTSKPILSDVQSKLYQRTNTLMILGGSQGSIFLNNLVRDFFNKYKTDNLYVIHQVGIKDKNDWQKFYMDKNIPATVFDYNNQIEEFYKAADLIICRAGAGTLAEVVFFNKKCITIPLETKTTSHQILNAKAFASKYPNNIIFVEQNKINPDIIKNYLF